MSRPVLASALVGLLLLVACGQTLPAPSGSTASATSAASSGRPSEQASEEPEPVESSPGTTVTVDATLLEVLPERLDDVPVEADLETAGEVAGDPALQGAVEAIAAAIAVGPSDVDDPDYAVASIVRLLPGVYDDAFHRSWRDSFDEAVCAQAGGVEGHAEVRIGAFDTFIATCGGGVRTYHVHLVRNGSDVLVSLQAFGARQFGERMVGGLRE